MDEAECSEFSGIIFMPFKSLKSKLNLTPRPILLALERLEISSKDKSKKYKDKLDVLVSVIASVLADIRLTQVASEQVFILFQFICRHTLNLILHGDWNKNSSARFHVLNMTVMFKQFETLANKRKLSNLSYNIRSMINLFPDPWGNMAMTKIVNGETCSEDEVLDFLKSEIGSILITRLELMLIARCDDQALRLIETCLTCIESSKNSFHFMNFSSEIVTMKDLYLLILYRVRNDNQLSDQVKKMGLVETVKFINRCCVEDYLVGLRKSLKKMVDVVANMALFNAMIHPVLEESLLDEMIKLWFKLHTDKRFDLLKRMSINAISSQHLYHLLEVLVNNYGKTSKSLCIELYIRALTVNLNEIEKHKSNKDHEKVQSSEINLSNGFLSLAEYLKEDIVTSRECVLTAFSLYPTASCLEQIKQLAVESGFFIPKTAETPITNSGICPKCKAPIDVTSLTQMETQNQFHLHGSSNQSTLSDQQLTDKLNKIYDSTNSNKTEHYHKNEANEQSNCVLVPSLIEISDAEQLCIPQTHCDDLLTVIGSARYQLLNWKLDWEELCSRCESYKISGKEARSSQKELKYLNIDYSQFRNCSPKRELCSQDDEDVFDDSVIDECKENICDGNQSQMEYSFNVPTRINEQSHLCNSSESELELSGIILVYKHKKNEC